MAKILHGAGLSGRARSNAVYQLTYRENLIENLGFAPADAAPESRQRGDGYCHGISRRTDFESSTATTRCEAFGIYIPAMLLGAVPPALWTAYVHNFMIPCPHLRAG